jgi:hypothetical protein
MVRCVRLPLCITLPSCLSALLGTRSQYVLLLLDTAHRGVLPHADAAPRWPAANLRLLCGGVQRNALRSPSS